MEHFTREVAYTPVNNVLVVFDRVADYRSELQEGVVAARRRQTIGRGRPKGKRCWPRRYDLFECLDLHLRRWRWALASSLVTSPGARGDHRGGPGWEFWTPGDEFGGTWGSGKNWPLDPPAGGPLPTDPYLRKMWKTFWGEKFEKLLPSNTRAVVPAAWRVEVSPAKPAKEDLFLHVLEIGDRGDPRAPRLSWWMAPILIGALVEGGTVTLFATSDGPVSDGEVTIPEVETANLLVTGLKPHAKYELQMTGGRANWRGGLFNGVPGGIYIGTANGSGVMHLPFKGQKDGRLRLRMLAHLRLTIRYIMKFYPLLHCQSYSLCFRTCSTPDEMKTSLREVNQVARPDPEPHVLRSSEQH